jgi:hypothetical protein
MLFVAAWFWPSRRQLDPRIAGRWQFSVTHNATPDPRRLIDFQSDGWVQTYFADGTPVPNVANGRWWVEGNQMVLLGGSRNFSRRIWFDLQMLVDRILGYPERWDVDRYEIIDIGPDEMRLRFLPHPGQKKEDADWVLMRAAE